jgi:K+ transporter
VSFRKTSLLYLKKEFDEFLKVLHEHIAQKPTFKIIIRRITDYTRIIYGDIGTSPLYVMKAILGESIINADVVLGEFQLSLDPTLQTTIKYVIITLSADNHGEGGILLYALVKRQKLNG